MTSRPWPFGGIQKEIKFPFRQNLVVALLQPPVLISDYAENQSQEIFQTQAERRVYAPRPA